MYTRILVPAIGLLLAAGCQQPSDIELTLTDNDTNLEAYSIILPDTNIQLQSIDSLGVLPNDQVQFRGLVLLNHATYDNGLGIRSAAYSQVFFADTAVRHVGKTIGFSGVDLGAVRLNGTPMVRLAHRVPLNRLFGRDTVLLQGYEYVTDLTSTYQPDKQYTWQVNSPTMGVFAFTAAAPENLTVLSPQGGAIVSRSQKLVLGWQGGKGSMTIIISGIDLLERRVKPLVEFRAKVNTGRAVIPGKLLRELPGYRYVVFTFILGNRKETTIVQPQFAGKIVAQAASIYNSYVQLQ